MSEAKSGAGLSPVKFDRNWLTSEYGQLVLNLYREQAARVIQRAFRTLKKDGKLPKKANADWVMGVLQEPHDDHHSVYAEKIRMGDYLSLAYDDPNFIRSLFKALRLKEITLNQMVMAHSIHGAKEWLYPNQDIKSQMHTFQFSDPKGPYQVSNIAFATASAQKDFHQNLKEIDNTYITINFSPLNEYLFFRYHMAGDHVKSQLFLSLLEKYVMHAILPEKEKIHFKELLGDFRNKELPEDFSNKKNEILFTIDQVYAEKVHCSQNDLSLFKRDIKDVRDGSIIMFGILVSLSSQYPFCVLSPDYNPDDSASPIVSLVTITPDAERTLLLALFGDEATLPAHTVGSVSTRAIRAFDDRPTPSHTLSAEPDSNVSQKFSAAYGPIYRFFKQSARQIQLKHGEWKENPNTDGYACNEFMRQVHDRFHCWRNSEHFKILIRRLRDLFSQKGIVQKKSREMSKAIWMLTDMDFSEAQKIHLAMKKSGVFPLHMMINHLFDLIGSACTLGKDNFIFSAKKSLDLYLMVFIDMIRNSKEWDAAIVKLPGIARYQPVPTFLGLLKKAYVHSDLQVTIPNIFTSFLNDRPFIALIKDKRNTTENLILRYRLKNMSGSSALCDYFQKIDMSPFLFWKLNAGLSFKDFCEKKIFYVFANGKEALDDIEEDQLSFLLCLIAIKNNFPKDAYFSLLTSVISEYCKKNSILYTSFLNQEKGLSLPIDKESIEVFFATVNHFDLAFENTPAYLLAKDQLFLSTFSGFLNNNDFEPSALTFLETTLLEKYQKEHFLQDDFEEILQSIRKHTHYPPQSVTSRVIARYWSELPRCDQDYFVAHPTMLATILLKKFEERFSKFDDFLASIPSPFRAVVMGHCYLSLVNTPDEIPSPIEYILESFDKESFLSFLKTLCAQSSADITAHIKAIFDLLIRSEQQNREIIKRNRYAMEESPFLQPTHLPLIEIMQEHVQKMTDVLNPEDPVIREIVAYQFPEAPEFQQPDTDDLPATPQDFFRFDF